MLLDDKQGFFNATLKQDSLTRFDLAHVSTTHVVRYSAVLFTKIPICTLYNGLAREGNLPAILGKLLHEPMCLLLCVDVFNTICSGGM